MKIGNTEIPMNVLTDAAKGMGNALAIGALMAEGKHAEATKYVLGLTVSETQAALIAAATLMAKFAQK